RPAAALGEPRDLGRGTRGEAALSETAGGVPLVAAGRAHHGVGADVRDLAELRDEAFEVARLHLRGPRAAPAERDQVAAPADRAPLPGPGAQAREVVVPALGEAAAGDVERRGARELAHLERAVGVDGERALAGAALVDALALHGLVRGRHEPPAELLEVA